MAAGRIYSLQVTSFPGILESNNVRNRNSWGLAKEMIRMNVSGEIQEETFIGSFYADIEPMKRPKKGVIWLVPNHTQANHSLIWTMSQQIMRI